MYNNIIFLIQFENNIFFNTYKNAQVKHLSAFLFSEQVRQVISHLSSIFKHVEGGLMFAEKENPCIQVIHFEFSLFSEHYMQVKLHLSLTKVV